MNDGQPSSQSTGSYDSVLGQFLQQLDHAHTEASIAGLLAQAIAQNPERADELRTLANGFKNLRGLRDPERLGRYRIRRVLAVGGMGKVYEAEEDELPRIVAVKTIKFGRTAEPHALERFDRERRTLARLHHTNIVPIYSTGREAELLYFSMPRINGPSLRAVIKTASSLSSPSTPPSVSTFEDLVSEASAEEAKEHASRAADESLGTPSLESDDPESTRGRPSVLKLPPDYRQRVARLMADAAEAVYHANQAGVIHRDLKPANILVERQGHPWVLDFGLAHFKGESAHPTDTTVAAPESNGETDLSGPSVGVGTPLYWAPEQVPSSRRPHSVAAGVPIDHRTDVWGLGVTLYELLTLRRPFSKIEQILTAAPVPPRQLVARFPRELEAICLKTLEKRPEDRYRTAQHLADDLRRWLRGEPTVAGKAGAVRRTTMWVKRNPSWAMLAVVVGLLVALTCAMLLFFSDMRRRHAVAQAREVELVALSRNGSIGATRRNGWYGEMWRHVEKLRTDSSRDPRLQGVAASFLEGMDGRVVKSLPGAAKVLQFDDRGEHLLICWDKAVDTEKPVFRTTLWDRLTDQTLAERDLGPGVLAFKPDSTPLQLSWVKEASSNLCKRLRLYNVTSGDALEEYRAPGEGKVGFHAISLSRHASHVAAVAARLRDEPEEIVPDGEDRTIIVWEVGSKQPLRTFPHRLTQDILLSPDGRLLAAWDEKGEVTVWTIPEGKQVSRFRVGRASVNCLAFGRDPTWYEEGDLPPWLLAVGESSGLVTIWSIRENRPRSVCRGSSYDIRVMDFSDDGAILITSGLSPDLIWDVATGTCLLELSVGVPSTAISIARDGRHYALSWYPGWKPELAAVEIVELERGRGIQTLYGLQGRVEKTLFSPNGRLVAAATHEWQVGLWEWPSGRLLGVLPAPVGRFVDSLALAFDREGRQLACSAGRQARLWDIEARRLVKTWDLPEGLCESLAFNADGPLLLARCETESRRYGPFSAIDPRKEPRVVRVYDLLGRNPKQPNCEIRDFPLHIHNVNIDPGGRTLVVQGIGIEAGKGVELSRVYEAITGKLLKELPGARQPIPSTLSMFDPSGDVFGVTLDPPKKDHNELALFGRASLEVLGSISTGVHALNRGATRWLTVSDREGVRPPELILNSRDNAEPLLHLANDMEMPALSMRFSIDGRYIAAGKSNSHVWVLDLVEMNRRLSELHLGW